MNKKKIIILSHAMEIGGAERALLGVLNSIDYEKYEVDLFLNRTEGELLNFIPKSVEILPTNQAKYLAVPIKTLVSHMAIKMLYGRLRAKILAKKRVEELNLKAENQVALTYSHKYTYSYMDDINPNVEYDLAISFLTPHYICTEKVRARKRIAWIHTDYSTIDIDINEELDMWEKYDYIASISDSCTDAFLKKFPSLSDKIVRIDNIITEQMIVQQANERLFKKEITDDSIKLLSIGRFTYQKNFDNVPEICKCILESGLNVRWYLIGYGGDEALIQAKIKEFDMQEHVIVLGKQDNPYPYIKACDIYVQPSRYEGKAVTVREAQILCKPVVITRFATAKTQLDEGYDGIVVPMDNLGCAQGIINLIRDIKLQEQLVENMKHTNYSNEYEINKIYALLERQ